jgi:glutamate-5-semialdehyde dehydrogenase
VIPRGGETLIRFVHEHARVPTIQHFQGVCHVYVDKSADLDKALEIVATARPARPRRATPPSACWCTRPWPRASSSQARRACRGRTASRSAARNGSHRSRAGAASVKPADESDFGSEFLDLILAARVVDSLDDAVEHIAEYASDHTEAMVSKDDREHSTSSSAG